MSEWVEQHKPPPPPAFRWAVLVFTSLAMFGNYYVYDAVAPLAGMLSEQLKFTDTQIGTLNAIYSFPNIIMVLIGGIIVDRFGTRRATLCFTGICTLGALMTAASPSFPVMAAGRLVFGLGAESMIVAVTAALGQWFKGRQLGLAFGLNLSIARAGSYAADLAPHSRILRGGGSSKPRDRLIQFSLHAASSGESAGAAHDGEVAEPQQTGRSWRGGTAASATTGCWSRCGPAPRRRSRRSGRSSSRSTRGT